MISDCKNIENIQNVDMHINDLASVVFKYNINDFSLMLSLHGLENKKDLFYFCVDLFCKGLVMLYGSGNSVEIATVTQEQFDHLRKKMRNAGIDVRLEVRPDENNNQNNQNNDQSVSSLNFAAIESLPDNLDVNEYSFELRTMNLVYKVTFDLIHNV